MVRWYGPLELGEPDSGQSGMGDFAVMLWIAVQPIQRLCHSGDIDFPHQERRVLRLSRTHGADEFSSALPQLTKRWMSGHDLWFAADLTQHHSE